MDLLTTRYFGPYRPGQAPLGVGRGQLISAFTPPPCSCCVPPRVHRAGEAAQYGVELKAASAQEIAAREALENNIGFALYGLSPVVVAAGVGFLGWLAYSRFR